MTDKSYREIRWCRDPRRRCAAIRVRAAKQCCFCGATVDEVGIRLCEKHRRTLESRGELTLTDHRLIVKTDDGFIVIALAEAMTTTP